MDQPKLDPYRHELALHGLARLNHVSGSARILWSYLHPLAARGPLRILDVASGGGDVLLELNRRAQSYGCDVQLSGCDVQPRAVEFARRCAEQAGVGVQFFLFDALRDPLPDGYDVIMCSLFLHHLGDDETIHLLRVMKLAARRMVLINDLNRGLLAYAGVWLASRMLTRSDVVLVDGPRSVRAAYCPPEALSLAQRAGLQGVTLRRHFPFRWVLRWER